jgi:hypothetical protein
MGKASIAFARLVDAIATARSEAELATLEAQAAAVHYDGRRRATSRHRSRRAGCN